MKLLPYVPKYWELNEYYGAPENHSMLFDDLFMKRLVRTVLPYPMRLSWKKDTSVDAVLVHELIASVVADAEKEILDYQGYQYLRDFDFDILGGVFNYRPQRGARMLSTHAWGIAIDRNPNFAPYRKTRPDGTFWNNQPKFIKDAYLKRGFVTFDWDGMHFQACQSPSGVCYEGVIEQINNGGLVHGGGDR